MKNKNMIDCLNFIQGKWQIPTQKLKILCDTYTGKPLANTFQSSAKDLHFAVTAAQKAQRVWKEFSFQERAQCLSQFLSVLKNNAENIAKTISMECGKLPQEAKEGLSKGFEVIEFAMGLQNNTHLISKLPVSKGVTCEFLQEPLGVVAGITPSNFPAMVPLWMIPLALITGNSFIWKPSEKTPLTSLLVGEAFKKCSFPEGVFTILQGDQETVQKICEHKNIKAIAFVGSTPAAKMVYTQASAQGKRVLALGGAKNHIILMPDADQQMAVQGILASFTGCAGQRCMAGSVLLAVGETTEVIKILCAQARQFLPGKHMGALISQDSVARLTLAIERAKQEGVHLRVDGRRPTLPTKYLKGNWLNPTILDEVSPESFAVKEELFGPLLSIVRCKNLEEALRIENASAYGNAVSVFTSQGYHAERVVQEAQAAMVGINVGVPVPREPFSFGGTKDSKWGHGDLTGHDGVEFWTQKKKITTKWATQEKQTWIS